MNNLEIFHMSKKLMSVYERHCIEVCQKFDLTQSSFDIMMFLANNQQYNTAKEICEIRGVKTGIVSVMVEKLIQKGYLVRKTDDKDRRIVRLYLTEDSKDAVSEGKIVQQSFLQQLSCNMTEEEMNYFDSVLNKLKVNLEEME